MEIFVPGGTCHVLGLEQRKDAQQTKQQGCWVGPWAEAAGFPCWSEKDREKRKDTRCAGLKDLPWEIRMYLYLYA